MEIPQGNGPFDLSRFPLHLGVGATALPQPAFTGDMAWYEGYGARTASDGKEGRLVSQHTFEKPWDTWEMHPEGWEVVIVTSGELTIHQEIDGAVVTNQVRPGELILNPPGVWHTADAAAPATAIFLTCGAGTQLKPR